MSPSLYNTWATNSGVMRSDPSGECVYTLGWVNANPAIIGFAIAPHGSMTIVPDAPRADSGAREGDFGR